MSLALVLMVGAALAALIDLALHVLQLWPKLVPSQAVVQYMTLASGVLLVASCITAFNLGALLMGIGIIVLTGLSVVTGKELHE